MKKPFEWDKLVFFLKQTYLWWLHNDVGWWLSDVYGLHLLPLLLKCFSCNQTNLFEHLYVKKLVKLIQDPACNAGFSISICSQSVKTNPRWWVLCNLTLLTLWTWPWEGVLTTIAGELVCKETQQKSIQQWNQQSKGHTAYEHYIVLSTVATSHWISIKSQQMSSDRVTLAPPSGGRRLISLVSRLHEGGCNFEDALLINTVDAAIFDWRTQLNTEQVVLLEWRSVSTVRSLALTPLLFCQKQHPSTNHLSAPPVKATTRRWLCTSLGSEALYLIQIKWKLMWGRHRKS